MKARDDTTEMVSKVILLVGTCDLPAKCLVCNSVQYNGSYGCFKCKQRGQTAKVSAQGHGMHFLLYKLIHTAQKELIQKHCKTQKQQLKVVKL